MSTGLWDFACGFKLLMGIMPRPDAVARWVNQSLSVSLYREKQKEWMGFYLGVLASIFWAAQVLERFLVPAQRVLEASWLGQNRLARQILVSLLCCLINCCSAPLSRCFPHHLAWPSGSPSDCVLPVFWSLPLARSCDLWGSLTPVRVLERGAAALPTVSLWHDVSYF